MKETGVWNNFNNLNVNVLNNNLVWPRDFESFQCAKFNTFLPVYCDVQVCYGTAVEHRSLLNRSSVCGRITCCNIFVCSCRRLCIKTAFNLVKRPLLFHAIVIQWSAIIYIFVGHVVIVFGRLKYIPRLFSEYMVTFMVEEPMKILKPKLQSQNKNYRRQDWFNQNNRELKSKNKYSVNQTRTRQQNVVHRNGTTYIGKNFPNHFLEQRVSDRAGGTPQNNIQNANQAHTRPI